MRRAADRPAVVTLTPPPPHFRDSCPRSLPAPATPPNLCLPAFAPSHTLTLQPAATPPPPPGLVSEVHKFSKFIHGTAALFPDMVQAVPYWVDDDSGAPRRDAGGASRAALCAVRRRAVPARCGALSRFLCAVACGGVCPISGLTA